MTEASRRSESPVDLVLVGCVKTQLDHPAPADELFLSPLFRYRREFAERRQWAAEVVHDLVRRTGDPAGRVIEIHAGSAHAHVVSALLRERGATVLLPLRGLTQGGHLAWYRARLR